MNLPSDTESHASINSLELLPSSRAGHHEQHSPVIRGAPHQCGPAHPHTAVLLPPPQGGPPRGVHGVPDTPHERAHG